VHRVGCVSRLCARGYAVLCPAAACLASAAPPRRHVPSRGGHGGLWCAQGPAASHTCAAAAPCQPDSACVGIPAALWMSAMPLPPTLAPASPRPTRPHRLPQLPARAQARSGHSARPGREAGRGRLRARPRGAGAARAAAGRGRRRRRGARGRRSADRRAARLLRGCGLGGWGGLRLCACRGCCSGGERPLRAARARGKSAGAKKCCGLVQLKEDRLLLHAT
jgi:hypothetical protein